MMRRATVCLVMLLIWGAAALASDRQLVEVASLDRIASPVDGWRFASGDDPEWARPDFDDSAWKPANVELAWAQWHHGDSPGSSWYRLDAALPVPEAGSRPPVAVAIGKIEYSSYEVYAGGERIGGFGAVPPEARTLPGRPQTFLVPDRAIGPDGHLVVAVRMWRDPDYIRMASAFDRDHDGVFLLGPPSALADRLELDRLRDRQGDLPRLVCSVLFAVIGLYHLQLFRRRHEQREYFWFGLLTLSAATNFFVASEWASGLVTPMRSYSIMMALFHLNGGILWIRFLWGLFGWKFGPWMKAYQALHFGFAVVTLAFPEFAAVDLGLWPIIAFAPTFVVWLVLIPREALRGNPAARTLCLGLLGLAAARAYQVMMAFGMVPSQNFAHWGFVALLLSMAVSLSNRFNLVYTQLDALNQDLEDKVKRRTAELGETVERLRISERQALEASEVALEASRAKSTFLANMSHELRTPLNAILGFVQLMRRNQSMDADGHESLDIITHSGEHLLTLITDILSISKIEAGQVTLTERDFDLHRLLRGLEETFHLRAEARELQLRFEVAPDLPRYVRGDEGKVRQVLINLLGNAIKFTDEGHVILRARYEGSRAFFEVEDTGHGIGQNEIGNLFQPFVQTESGQKVKEGTGLGLAISRSIARLMDGDIRVESELGRGATFSVEMRLPEAHGVEARPEPRAVVGLEPDQSPYRILVTDDTPENRKLLVKLLTSVGFQVQEAVNGLQAVEAWESWRPHLIFMDIRMPVLDGIEATRRIRSKESAECSVLSAESKNLEHAELSSDHLAITSDHSALSTQHSALPPPRCRIIALTASAFEHDRDRILAAGCDDFVPKPFRDAALFAKMVEHLGVRFLYQERRASGPRQIAAPEAETALTGFEALPADLVAGLGRFVTEGDVDGANRVIEQIRPQNPELADRLRALVKAYQFDEILEAVERVAID